MFLDKLSDRNTFSAVTQETSQDSTDFILFFSPYRKIHYTVRFNSFSFAYASTEIRRYVVKIKKRCLQTKYTFNKLLS